MRPINKHIKFFPRFREKILTPFWNHWCSFVTEQWLFIICHEVPHATIRVAYRSHCCHQNLHIISASIIQKANCFWYSRIILRWMKQKGWTRKITTSYKQNAGENRWHCEWGQAERWFTWRYGKHTIQDQRGMDWPPA